MNDDSIALAEECSMAASFTTDDVDHRSNFSSPHIPTYLEDTYWWAYLRPGSVWLFEREWLVNLILWGNMHRLTDAVLEEVDHKSHGPVLQVACVYGDFSNRLAAHLHNLGTRLHLVDIAPIQLKNARDKLQHHDNVRLHHQDSSQLRFPAGHFEHTVVFFLLHEQPEEVRRRTISEAIRVTRPGGKVTFVDYHAPRRTNPIGLLMYPVLRWLEPYALDLWKTGLPEYFPPGIAREQVRSEYYFGGLYQKIVITC